MANDKIEKQSNKETAFHSAYKNTTTFDLFSSSKNSN